MKAILFVLVVLASVLDNGTPSIFEEGSENVVIIRPEVQSFFLSRDTGSSSNTDAKHRTKRMASGYRCEVPKSPGNSEICCRYAEGQMKCVQTCVWGHTLLEGRQRHFNCHNGIWEHGNAVLDLDMCKPYVDCTLELGPGSKVECWSNFMDHGPICEVSCEKFEDRLSVNKLMYKCDIKGEWTPRLPLCVSPGTGAGLVVAPKAHK